MRFLNEFIKAHERRSKLSIIDDTKIQVEVGKQKHGQVQTALIHGKLGFSQIALPVIGLNLSFDHICVRHFSAVFQLLAQGQKLLSFRCSPLHVGVLALRGNQPVIALHHGHYQPAFCDLGLGSGNSLQGPRPSIVGVVGIPDYLMNVALAEVLMHCVVSNEYA